MNEKLMRLGASPLSYLDHTVLNDESTSASSILVTPFLEQNKHKFLSERPLRTPGKFYLKFALYVLFAFTSLLIMSTLLLKYSIMQIQIRKRQTEQKCPRERAGKSQHFSILIKTSKS